MYIKRKAWISHVCNSCKTTIKVNDVHYRSSKNKRLCINCINKAEIPKKNKPKYKLEKKVSLYRTPEEIMRAVKKLEIKGSSDYNKKYKLNPKLPSRPDRMPGFVSVTYQLNREKRKQNN